MQTANIYPTQVKIMTYRNIEFKKIALQHPETYVAMLKDGVEHWESSFDNAILRDNNSDNYPALRAFFLSEGYSYDFFKIEAGGCDHTNWIRGRNGEEIHTSISYQSADYIELNALSK